MEGCYNGFIGSEYSGNFAPFETDLCGYMYLFNNNPTLLSQLATLGYAAGVSVSGGGPEVSTPVSGLFKDLLLSSAYGGMYDPPAYLGYSSNIGVTLYANMACVYEHWLVRSMLLSVPCRCTVTMGCPLDGDTARAQKGTAP